MVAPANLSLSPDEFSRLACSVNWGLSGAAADSGQLASGQLLTGTLNWAVGDAATKTIAVQVLADTADEVDKALTATLSGVNSANLGTSSATTTILDDDDSSGTSGIPEHPTGFNGTVRRVGPGYYATVAAAVTASSAGDVVLIGDGTITADVTLTQSFAAPGILIKGENLQNSRTPKSRMNGSWKITGDGYWLYHLRFAYTNASSDTKRCLSIDASRVTVTRCWINSLLGGIMVDGTSNCNDIRICYNRFAATVNGLQREFLFFNCPGDMPNPTGSTGWHKNCLVARNYWNMGGTKDNNNRYFFYIGTGHAEGNDYRCMSSFDILDNLMEVESAGWDKFLYLKCGVRKINGNTLDGPAAFITRHGSLRNTNGPGSADTLSTVTNQEIIGNWMNISTFWLNGAGHYLRDNRVGCNGGLKLSCGYLKDGGGQKYDAAHDVTSVGNEFFTNGPHYKAGYYETNPDFSDARGGKTRNLKVFDARGSGKPTAVSNLVFNSSHCLSGTFSLNPTRPSSTSYEPTVPARVNPTKWTQSNTGFKVTGQEAYA